MQELETALDEGIWAIASTAAGKYIGQLVAIGTDDGKPFIRSEMTKNYFIEHIANPTRMRWPLEFSAVMVPMHIDTPQGPRVAFDRQVTAAPLGHCYDVENLTVVITPVDYIFFNDMSKTDAEWHRNLIRNTLGMLLKQRLAAANIIDPATAMRQMQNVR